MSLEESRSFPRAENCDSFYISHTATSFGIAFIGKFRYDEYNGTGLDVGSLAGVLDGINPAGGMEFAWNHSVKSSGVWIDAVQHRLALGCMVNRVKLHKSNDV
ncbi:hypothetical protein J2T18_004453 [Paenibacillus polymyxa]|uniref:hypothetical protein n=1 Tax=Paenibacillus polymyxa TaxID=1406 RepID=UPI002794E659|nr:hypothetical protein [Paenibacillus polymyxa]MDQ0050125.1 hypothetical protein [Paenibacillus polymyxa]